MPEKARFILPPDASRRFFIFEDGERRRMYPIRRQVRAPEELAELDAEKKPSGIYVSRGRWVDAPNMPGKKRRINSYPFLGADVVFDIEPGQDDPLGMARRCFSAGKVRYPGAEVFGNATGSGGYHIWFLGVFPGFRFSIAGWRHGLALRTSDREAQFAAWLKGEDAFFRKGFKLEFCGNSFADTTHVFRVAGSSHSGTGEPVVRLPEFTLAPRFPDSLAGQTATMLSASSADEVDDALRESPGDGVEAELNLQRSAGRASASAPGDWDDKI